MKRVFSALFVVALFTACGDEKEGTTEVAQQTNTL